jgi:hypothetical protein
MKKQRFVIVLGVFLPLVAFAGKTGDDTTFTSPAISTTFSTSTTSTTSTTSDHPQENSSEKKVLESKSNVQSVSPREYFDQLEEINDPAKDKKWEILNTRDGKGSVPYLRNVHHGLYSSFIPWFDQTEKRSRSYEQMMRMTHTNTISGVDGEPYTGISPQEHGHEGTPQPYPGQFRHEVRVVDKEDKNKKWPLNDRGHTWHIRMDVKYPKPEEGFSDRFKRLQDAYVADPATDKVWEPEPGTLEAKDHNGAPEYFPKALNREKHYSLDAIRMPGTKLPIPVHNQIYKHTVLHQYPRHEMKPYLLKAMSETTSELRKLAVEKKDDPETLNRVVDLVAQYIYLGSHAHLFESVNMSLIVAQANYMLSRFNLDGIKSGTLDFRGMYEQFPEFAAFVRKELTAVNPQLNGLKSNFPRSPLISVLAHIQDHGDIYFPEGQSAKHPIEPGKNIEGIMITSALPESIQLQYMGHIQGTPTQAGGDTPWTDARTFIGTAGQGRSMEGVAFRLLSKNGSDPVPYSIHYKVKVDGEWTSGCSDAEYCGTREKDKPITALKVWLTEKPQLQESVGEKSNQEIEAASVNHRESKSIIAESPHFSSDSDSVSSAASAK